jgi:hypothetical protein
MKKKTILKIAYLWVMLFLTTTGYGQFLKMDATSGYIGIGTTAPQTPLHVFAYTGAWGQVLRSEVNNQNGLVLILN